MDQGETQMELRVLDLTMTSGRRLMSQNSNTPNVPIECKRHPVTMQALRVCNLVNTVFLIKLM